MALAQGHIKENHKCVLLFTILTSLRQFTLNQILLSRSEITRKGGTRSSLYRVLSAMALWQWTVVWALASMSHIGTENTVILSSKTPFQRAEASRAARTTEGRDKTLMFFQKEENQVGRGGGQLHSSKAGEVPWPAVGGGWCRWVLAHAMLCYSREEQAQHHAGRKRQPERE